MIDQRQEVRLPPETGRPVACSRRGSRRSQRLERASVASQSVVSVRMPEQAGKALAPAALVWQLWPSGLRTRWTERLVRAAESGDDSSREVEGPLSDGVRATTALTQSHPYALRYLRLPDRTIESVVTLADVRSRSIEKARRRFA